jgi:hypothetical protein
VNTGGGTGVSVTAGGNGVRAEGGKSDGDTSPAGAGVVAVGGNSSSLTFAGGNGVFAFGGSASEHDGGAGVVASGGSSTASGGTGVSANGGAAVGTSGSGGDGVITAGGGGPNGGDGVLARGGNSIDSGAGGTGVVAIGGTGAFSDAQNRGGTGIIASGGQGTNGSMRGFAGIFIGDLEVRDGNFAVLAGGTKNFKIDHPLDPENKYLYHAAIESSEVLNVYSGNVTTDEMGESTVSLPDWFQAINRDFRYQLTVVGTFAQAIVADEIQKNRFRIKTSVPRVKVSWQVIGVRSDAAFLRRSFKVEEEKPQAERGTYLSPEAYNQPEERGVKFAHQPEMMRSIRETGSKQIEKSSKGPNQ